MVWIVLGVPMLAVSFFMLSVGKPGGRAHALVLRSSLMEQSYAFGMILVFVFGVVLLIKGVFDLTA